MRLGEMVPTQLLLRTSVRARESSQRGSLSEMSPEAAGRILHEGITRWTKPYGAS